MAAPDQPDLTDEQILEYEQKIKDEEAHKTPLVCQDEPMAVLEKEFQGNDAMLRKVKHLEGTHNRVRKCCGDGNCFFRAFAFAWFENLLRDKESYQRALAIMQATPDLLECAQFQKLAFEDFYDITLEQLLNLPSYAGDADLLLANFQTEELSNAIVMHLRFVASAYLKLHSAEYEPFLIDEMISVDEYCSRHVEAFGKEADHLHIIALSKALHTPVQVVYLDSGAGDEATVHDFTSHDLADPQLEPVHLLYRPGHYDILYKKHVMQ